MDQNYAGLMTSESAVAYQRSFVLALTVVLWIGTLLWFVPLLVSVVWTLLAVYLIARQRRSERVHLRSPV